MTGAREEALERVPCIHYPVQFKWDTAQALINLGSEVNAIHLTFAKQLGLPVRPTDIRAQKIDDTTLNTYGMVVAAFSVVDKANRVRFFEKTCLVANVSPKVFFGMLFLTLSGANVDFLGLELRWRTYTTEKAFQTTRRIKLVRKKEFAAAALDPGHEIFVVHVASLNSTLLDRPQISDLIAEEAPTNVPAEYSDFANVFSPDLASELLKHTGINNHAIELVEGCQQLPYELIYSLKPVELEILKAYIETNLANRFIRPLKSPTGTPILFDRKSDGSLRLCVNY